MKSCAFFGHRKADYGGIENSLRNIIKKLVEEEGVLQFYLGMRGDFDAFCLKTVYQLKKEFPEIKITKVFAYMPARKEENALCFFDDSVYLLERTVPPKYAILETNCTLIRKVDFIVSGVKYTFGGAAKAIDYAKKQKKTVIDVFSL